MNDNQLKQEALQNLAEQAIPVDYDPWIVVQKRLNGIQSTPKILMRSTSRKAVHIKKRVQFAGAAALFIILIVCGFFFITPRGRVMAQGIIHLFSKAGGNTLPLPTGLLPEQIPPTPTAAATRIIGLQTVDPESSNVGGASFLTPTPNPKRNNGLVTSGLTIVEAETLAGFTIRVPQSIPAGYYLDDVIYNQQTWTVQQFYKYNPYQSGEMFIISQELSLPNDVIGQSAEFNQFFVGDVIVEWVNGSWFASPGAKQEAWDPSAPIHTFRWQEKDFYYTLQFWIGDTFSPAYLDMEDMQALIELIIGTRTSLPEQIDLNNLRSVFEAQSVTGFEIYEPSILPAGYRFSYAAYEPDVKRVVLIYQPEASSRASSGADLVIFEIFDPVTPADLSSDGFPPDAVVQVMIGNNPSTFVRGAVVDGVYDPEFGLTIWWQIGELHISIRFHNSVNYPARLEMEDLIAIAESFH